MKPRVAAEATGGVAFVLVFLLIYEYSALRADFWYLLFALAGFVGFVAYSAFPVAEVPVQAESQSDFGPIMEEPGFPLPEFEKAKIQDSVEMVRELHDAVKPGAADYSETSYNFAGVRGKIVKGKAPQQEQSERQEPEPDFLSSLPPPED